MRSVKTRLVSLLLSVVMVLSLLPMGVFAEGDAVSQIDAIIESGRVAVNSKMNGYAVLDEIMHPDATNRTVAVLIINGETQVTTVYNDIIETLVTRLNDAGSMVASVSNAGEKYTSDTKLAIPCDTSGTQVKAFAKSFYKDLSGGTKISNLIGKTFSVMVTGKDGNVSVTYHLTFVDNATAAPHKHTLEQVAATAPTCEKDGTKAYYKCKSCGAMFSDKDGKTRITEPPVDPAQHSLDLVDAVEATCEKDGMKAYFKCSVCGKLFSDPSAHYPLENTDNLVVKANGKHVWSNWEVTKEATLTEEGVKSRACTICGEIESKSTGKAEPVAKVNSSNLKLKTNQSTTKVQVTMAPGDSIVSAKSSNKKIAKVKILEDGRIKIKAKKKTGTVKIKVKLASGKTVKFKVKVQKNKVLTAKVTAPAKMNLDKGEKASLGAKITPVTTSQGVSYHSSNPSVAKVTKDGVVKALKKGTATITVTSGSKKAVCKVKVS